MHGYFSIILKESFRLIPIVGVGMKFFSFLFLSRQWEKDRPRLKHHISSLKRKHSGHKLDPMWLLIFPEGTNLSDNTRAISQKWAIKSGIQDLNHSLLPRTRGLQYCLEELDDTIEWVYDCTLAYDGIL